VQQYAGASQTQIGMACGMNQGKISDIIRGIQKVESLAVFERMAPDSMSFNVMARPAAREPGILVTLVRCLTSAKVDSIGLVVRICSPTSVLAGAE
jgi:hypothetical protein